MIWVAPSQTQADRMVGWSVSAKPDYSAPTTNGIGSKFIHALKNV